MKRLVGLLALAGCLGAQEAETDARLERALNEVQLRAAGRRIQGAQEAPADVTVLSGRELRAFGYRTVGAALAGVLGFRDNDDRAYANVGVRGLYLLGDQNTRILVLLDGHALNSAAEVGSSKVGEDFAIPMARIDRIEIVRGPASSLYGNNAFLAVVNVVTLEAVGEGPREGRLGLFGGTGGLGGVWGSLGGGTPALRVGFNLGSFRRGGASTSFPELGVSDLPASLDQERRDHAYLFLQGRAWTLSAYLMNRVQRLPQAPFMSQVGSGDNLYQNRMAFAEFRAEPRWGEVQGLARLSWDWNLFADRLRYDGVRDPSLTGLWQDRDLDRGLGAEFQLRTPLGEDWTLTAGVEQAWHRFEYTLSGPDTLNPREIRYRVRKVYGEGEWNPTAQVVLTLGLQRSELRLDEARSLADPSRVFPLGAYGHLSPRAALLWRPREGDTVKALYSEGFRNPTLFERFSEDDGLAFLDNPDLRMEALRCGTLLWLRDWGTGWSTQVGGSLLKWSDTIRAVDLDGTHQQFQNQAHPIEGRILEGQVRWRKGAWDAQATVALNRWRLDGADLDNAARTQTGLRLLWQGGGWSLAGEWRGVGPRSLEDQGRIPFQSTLRASLRWESGPAFLQLTGEDLLHRRPDQWVAADYLPVRRIRGDGRRAMLEAGWRF